MQGVLQGAGSRRARGHLQRALLSWFTAERRDLPWRRTRDPYAIWISEVLLQQTRVETALPYYERFLARFPDLQALAGASEEDVLAHWSGLGYYSRARALLAAAKVLVHEHGGAWPRTRAAALALPGVGPYTAGAVLSIAFAQREPLVDGNVQRVFARLFGLESPLGSKALAERCWELARELLPEEGIDPGDWNQALMELGARQCTPRAPDCAHCPVHSFCAAHAAGIVQQLPRARARRAVLGVTLEIALVRAGNKVLLQRRSECERMGGLLEFPTRERPEPGARARLWPTEFALGANPVLGPELGTLRHVITHHRILARVLHASVARKVRLSDGARWYGREELGGLAMTGLTRKALRWLGA